MLTLLLFSILIILSGILFILIKILVKIQPEIIEKEVYIEKPVTASPQKKGEFGIAKKGIGLKIIEEVKEQEFLNQK